MDIWAFCCPNLAPFSGMEYGFYELSIWKETVSNDTVHYIVISGCPNISCACGEYNQVFESVEHLKGCLLN